MGSREGLDHDAPPPRAGSASRTTPDDELLPAVAASLERRIAERRLPPPLRTADALVRFIETVGIAAESGAGPLPSLTVAIAGHELVGSWYADPAAHTIYGLLDRLEASSAVRRVFLGDRLAYLSAAAATDLAVVALDPHRVAAAVDGLADTDRELLRLIRLSGPAGFVVPAAHRTARLRLQRQLLVGAESRHRSSGVHESVAVGMEHSALVGLIGHRDVADRRVTEGAADSLVLAGVGAALMMPIRYVMRWFDEADAVIARLVERNLLWKGRHRRTQVVINLQDRLDSRPGRPLCVHP